MPNYVCNGTTMQCSFGTGAGSLTVLPYKKICAYMRIKHIINAVQSSLQTLSNNGSN